MHEQSDRSDGPDKSDSMSGLACGGSCAQLFSEE